MMVSELRIGNFIRDRKGRVCRVDGVEIDETTGFEIKAWPVGGGGLVSLPYSFIPLTEEWLLKFGAMPTADAKTFRLRGFEVSLRTGLLDSGIDAVNMNSPVDNVHQLQNLYFALTGEELEIKTNQPV